MVITHHGGQCFKVVFGDTTLAFDPISKQSALPPAKFGADIVFVSMHHPNFSGTAQMTHGTKQPFVAHGPGEYEVGDVTARGFAVKTHYDTQDRYNTIYQVQLEGMNIVFLGALGEAEVDPSILSELADIDILFVPIGGDDVLDVAAASKLAVKLEARLVIPMHYDQAALEAFLKEESAETTRPQDKLTLKRKDVQLMEGEIAVLQAR